MSGAYPLVSPEKRLLLARSDLNRLRLRIRREDLRNAFVLATAAPKPAPPTAWRRAAFVMAVSVAGRHRASRVVTGASRLLRIRRLVLAAVACVRALGAPRSCASVQTLPDPSRKLQAHTRTRSNP